MKYIFSIDNTNLIITLDTESGKYASEILTVNDPNVTLENDSIWLYENGKFLRFFSFENIGTIEGVTPTGISDAYGKLNTTINSLYLLVSPNFKGSITPTDTPSGTEDAVWIATQAGTYTNFGGVVVSANSRAEISRVGGVFSISQTTLDISGKLNVSDLSSDLNSTDITKGFNLAGAKALNDKFEDYVIKTNLLNELDLANYADTFNIPKWLLNKFLFLAQPRNISSGVLLNEIGIGSINATAETLKIPEKLGAEIVTNNTFNDTSYWLLNGGVISGGVMDIAGLNAYEGVYKTGVFEIGKTYKITYEIKNYVSGSFSIFDTFNQGVLRNGNGIYTEYFTAGATILALYAFSTGTDMDIDNISVKEVFVNTDYIDADTDNLWFTDSTPNSVLLKNLSAFDFNRTIVKYGNESPYDVEFVGILKSDAIFSDYEFAQMVKVFNLSFFYDNTLNNVGVLKQNRSFKKSVYLELLLNSSFNTETVWTKEWFNNGWQIMGGNAVCNSTDAKSIHQTIAPLIIGETYRFQFEIASFTSGSVRVQIDNIDSFYSEYYNTVGVHTADFVYTNAGYSPGRMDLKSNPAGFNGSISNFSIIKL